MKAKADERQYSKRRVANYRVVIWLLFGLWLTFTLLDMVISGLAIRFGAHEVGFLYQLCGDWNMTCFIKGIGAFLFGFVLVSYRQRGLLFISCFTYFVVCLYNAMVLWRQVGL